LCSACHKRDCSIPNSGDAQSFNLPGTLSQAFLRADDGSSVKAPFAKAIALPPAGGEILL
jgi:hypothetical protein